MKHRKNAFSEGVFYSWTDFNLSIVIMRVLTTFAFNRTHMLLILA
jgi:hypothetical protein